MSVKRNVVVAALLSAGLALALIACGSSTPELDQLQAAVLSGLPALPSGSRDVYHAPSMAQHAAQLGKDTFERSAGASENGNNLNLAASTGALEYAMYQFHTANPPDAITVNATPSQTGMEYWLALANYASFKWELAGPYTSTQMIQVSAMNGTFTSPGGNVYGVVLAYNGNTVQVGGTTVDYDDGVAAVTYTSDIQPIIANRCSPCHTAGASGGVSLNSYATASANANLALTQITQGSMPPSGALPAAQQNLWQAWVDQGKPE
jgi:hypothetical protein